ncbi:MAG: glycosyl transferase [Bacteroidales bacterium]|nr:glycosyl transferase [Bacteroidales bacterium]
MLPEVIHYCWFGGNPLPQLAEKCLASWRKYLPEYEIRRWDETSFDVDSHPYTKAAYEAGLYAFVSDYARFKILYENGGLYFDTDVEVIKPMDDIVEKGPFMGFENDGTKGKMAVNPGLGIGAEPGMALFKEILDRYESLPFFLEDGARNPFSMIPLVTELLVAEGLKGGSGVERAGGVTVYPQSWFNPFDDATGRLRKTPDTRTIHWYSKSWMPKENSLIVMAKRLARRMLGGDTVAKIGKAIK